jgi:hypothetical protein
LNFLRRSIRLPSIDRLSLLSAPLAVNPLPINPLLTATVQVYDIGRRQDSRGGTDYFVSVPAEVLPFRSQVSLPRLPILVAFWWYGSFPNRASVEAWLRGGRRPGKSHWHDLLNIRETPRYYGQVCVCRGLIEVGSTARRLGRDLMSVRVTAVGYAMQGRD